jgi:hypothetical protein
MATIRLRRFTQLSTLRSIHPARLIELLEPHREVFLSRGVVLPPNGAPDGIDYERLARALLSPDERMPPDLIDALYFIDEMATEKGMDALIAEAARRSCPLAVGPDASPADVAVQAWLLDRELVERKHAEQYLAAPRTYEYFQTALPNAPFAAPSPAQLSRLEQALDDAFETRNRGRGTRVFVFPKEDGAWVMVRHGEPFRREERLVCDDAPPSVCFRPVRYDVLGFTPAIGELQINARSRWEKELYCKQFGLHFFAQEQAFPPASKYTLEPLRESGERSLVCTDVPGIDRVTLKEAHFFWGGPYSEVEVRRADDVFAAAKAPGRALPEQARIIRATFQVWFTGHRAPRSVTIRPSNIAQYTRDDDAALVETWLRKRRFLVGRSANEAIGSALARA